MMRRRRMGRPGLVGTMARTAVVAGTATAVSGNVQRRQMANAQGEQAEAQAQADLADMQAQVAALQAQQPAPPPPPPAAGGGDDLATQLTKLADLKAAGVLSDEEFAGAKAKLLA